MPLEMANLQGESETIQWNTLGQLIVVIKCLNVYFLQDTWLEDDVFDIDVGGYHVFRHNGPMENQLCQGMTIVLSPLYYAGWKAVGAEPPTTTDATSDFVG